MKRIFLILFCLLQSVGLMAQMPCPIMPTNAQAILVALALMLMAGRGGTLFPKLVWHYTPRNGDTFFVVQSGPTTNGPWVNWNTFCSTNSNDWTYDRGANLVEFGLYERHLTNHFRVMVSNSTTGVSVVVPSTLLRKP
jgi:hypothetical protein